MEYTIGQIEKFEGGVPWGFVACNGALWSVRSNEALFSLIGTKYGGDGISSFALPNKPGYYICTEGLFPSPPHAQRK